MLFTGTETKACEVELEFTLMHLTMFLYVALNSNNVQVVAQTGEKHKTVLSDKDGIRDACCIAVRDTDDTVVISSFLSKDICTFKRGGNVKSKFV